LIRLSYFQRDLSHPLQINSTTEELKKMETILLSELQAGMKIGDKIITIVDVQEIWVKIYFYDGTYMTVKNSPQSTVVINPCRAAMVDAAEETIVYTIADNGRNNGTAATGFDPALYQPPFPYFGGKSRIAGEVWRRLGDTPNYVEPFFGSGAMLFLRPHWPFDARIETVNDKNGYVANFWRAINNDSGGVADYADWPQNENDLHARHWWLKQQHDDLTRRLEGDPDYYDIKIAGWWVWGMCLWIGHGFCDMGANGPWQSVEGELLKVAKEGDNGIWRQRIDLSSRGYGINRQRIHLGNGQGINRNRIHLLRSQGINRNRIHLGNTGRGINPTGTLRSRQRIHTYFEAIAERLRGVRVCSGDWSRVCGPTPTEKLGLTAVFLDPPYNADAGRDNKLYATEDIEVSHAVREWAIEHGDNPLLRIALCGYEAEHGHLMPGSWECVSWSAGNSYNSSSNSDNRHQERIWFSPHCLKPEKVQQFELFST